MQDIIIRKIKKSKVQKLKEIAKRHGYPSLNAYLLEKVEELAEEIEVVEYRKKYLETQEKNIEVIKQNNQLISELLEFMKGE